MQNDSTRPTNEPQAWMVWASLLIIGGVLFGGYRLLFSPTPAFNLSPQQREKFAACEEAFKEYDPSAEVPLRPVFNELIGWPNSSGFIFNGRPASAGCVLNPDGTVNGLTVNGKDVPNID